MRPRCRPFRGSAWVLSFILSGCATVPPDSVPWLLHKQEIHDAPWWGKPRATVLVSGIIAQPTDNKELISTGGQYAFGIPFGDNVGIDLTLGILPVDLKVAVPITAGNFVLYPFCSVFFRDTILLPRRRWHYDPGLELAFLATPDFAFKATAWTMRYETFEGLGTESKPFGLRTDFVSLSLEPIHSGPGMTLLSHLTLGYGYGGDHQSMVFFKLGLGAMTSPALYR